MSAYRVLTTLDAAMRLALSTTPATADDAMGRYASVRRPHRMDSTCWRIAACSN